MNCSQPAWVMGLHIGIDKLVNLYWESYKNRVSIASVNPVPGIN